MSMHRCVMAMANGAGDSGHANVHAQVHAHVPQHMLTMQRRPLAARAAATAAAQWRGRRD